jgi:hypothetical protein
MDDETDIEEDPTDDLEKQLESLAASEDDDGEEFADTIETLLEFSETSMEFARGPLTEEHKKAISEALKGRGGSDLKNTATKATAKARTTSDTIDKTRSDYNAQIDKGRGEVDSIRSALAGVPKGRAGTAQRAKIASQAKALMAKIKALRGSKKESVGSLTAIRSNQLTTAAVARRIIRERKAALREEITKLRDNVKM